MVSMKILKDNLNDFINKNINIKNNETLAIKFVLNILDHKTYDFDDDNKKLIKFIKDNLNVDFNDDCIDSINEFSSLKYYKKYLKKDNIGVIDLVEIQINCINENKVNKVVFRDF